MVATALNTSRAWISSNECYSLRPSSYQIRNSRCSCAAACREVGAGCSLQYSGTLPFSSSHRRERSRVVRWWLPRWLVVLFSASAPAPARSNARAAAEFLPPLNSCAVVFPLTVCLCASVPMTSLPVLHWAKMEGNQNYLFNCCVRRLRTHVFLFRACRSQMSSSRSSISME